MVDRKSWDLAFAFFSGVWLLDFVPGCGAVDLGIGGCDACELCLGLVSRKDLPALLLRRCFAREEVLGYVGFGSVSLSHV